MLSILPTCECGEIKGEHAVGTLCTTCNTKVKSVIDEDVEPILWFRKPIGITALINPEVWILLEKRFVKASGFNILHWLTDTTYRPTVRVPPVVDKIIDLNIPRGYNNFVQNFDFIMDSLFSLKEFSLKRGEVDFLYILLKNYRHAVFSDYIPLPNRTMLIVESTNVGVYVDASIVKAIDAIQIITSIDKNTNERNIRSKENRTVKALIKLTDFYKDFTRTNLSGKTGEFRRHILGSRTNFCFRAVITSITGVHNYGDIHAPWGVGVTAFRPQLLNKLLRMGFALNDAIGLLLGHVEKYHPLLDSMLKQLIAESKYGGIMCLEQRNPSLLQGSAQRKRITLFKTDPADHSVSTSILSVVSLNADFDGDFMNYSISVDNFMADKWEPLSPHYNVFEASTPRQVSRNITIPKPVIASISNFISKPAAEDPVKRRKMEELFH